MSYFDRPQLCCSPFQPMPQHPTPNMLASLESMQWRELEEPIDFMVPNCRHWTIKEVSTYFNFYFGDLIATFFSYSEIDGVALLLLNREHVMFDLQRLYRNEVIDEGIADMDDDMDDDIPRVPLQVLAQVWIHVSCLQHRRNAYDLFFNGLNAMYEWKWTLFTVPGDENYIGHPKDKDKQPGEQLMVMKGLSLSQH